MPARISWIDKEYGIICVTFAGRWTWHEFDMIWTQADDWKHQHGADLGVVVQFKGVPLCPLDVISRLRQPPYAAVMSEYQAPIVVVTRDYFLYELAIMFVELFFPNLRISFALSLDEAFEQIVGSGDRVV